MRARRLTAILTTTMLTAACGGAPAPRPAPTSPTSPASPAVATGPPSSAAAAPPGHVVVVVFENKANSRIVGNPDAPYLNGLLAQAAVFGNAHGVTHPSQPNYLALFSGSTQGVTDDHCPVRITGRPNLAQQLIASGRTFTGYSEGLPAAGYQGCSQGRYAAKHNPWADFDNVPAAANQPYTAWPSDPAALATVAFLVPDLCSDMHDCPVATGDAWAAAHLDGYLRWARGHDSWLVVTFDENDGSPGNQIYTIVAGAGVAPGRHDESVDHYSVLRAIEDRYGLAPLGQAASAVPLRLTGG